jgi:sarcosine oxidase
VSASGEAAGVVALAIAEARSSFPAIRFESTDVVLRDETAGVVAASDAIAGLAARARALGATILEGTRVVRIDRSRDPIRVETDRRTLLAERVVITAGAWVPRLVRPLAPPLAVARQTVAYLELAGDPGASELGRFPIWAFLGGGRNGMFYGLPAFGRPGVKAARHETEGGRDDPDAGTAEDVRGSGARRAAVDSNRGRPVPPDPRALEAVRAFFARRFTIPVTRIVGAETCLYTNEANEDFILDLWPGDPRIAVGSPCSGHGFKFGPLVGRILAGLVLEGRTDVPEFERARARFALRPASPPHPRTPPRGARNEGPPAATADSVPSLAPRSRTSPQ